MIFLKKTVADAAAFLFCSEFDYRKAWIIKK